MFLAWMIDVGILSGAFRPKYRTASLLFVGKTGGKRRVRQGSDDEEKEEKS
jgi:hypothetical protein